MTADPQYLRQHYAELSDGALLAINRADLVDAAQQCYDDEIGKRELASRGYPASARTIRISHVARPAEAGRDVHDERLGEPDKPEWFEEGATAFSRVDLPGRPPAPDLANVCDALEAAAIPCYLDLSDMPEEEGGGRERTHLWRVVVPGNLNLYATSVLERDIFNAEFEAEWKTHLEMLSDEQLRAMDPEETFCGLFDRVERVNRAYIEEIARRGLASK